MVQPVRIQLSRKKGFSLQAHSLALNGLPAVNVARPSRWGNPWQIGIARCSGSGTDYIEERVTDNEVAVKFFREMLPTLFRAYPSDEEIVRQLRGCNLACFCKPHMACHADVLIEIANAPPAGADHA